MLTCRNSVRWLYKLERSFTWDSKHAIPEDLIFLARAAGDGRPGSC